MLPKETALGQLTIIEIYEFYNMPVLFSCQNKAGHLYMAVWIDETVQADHWLYVSLSPQRFKQVRAGQMDLHHVFATPEDDIVLEVIVPKDAEQASAVRSISVVAMDKSWPPLPGEFLDIPQALPRVLWKNLDQRNIEGNDRIATLIAGLMLPVPQ